MPASGKPGGPLVLAASCRNDQAACPNALIDTRPWRRLLEERMQRLGVVERMAQRVSDDKALAHHRLRLVVAGCPNGCSRPQIADLGVVGFVRPRFDLAECTGCGLCVEACPDQAITLEHGAPVWDADQCLGCLACSRACPAGCIATSPPGMRLLVGGKLGRRPHLADQVLETTDPNMLLDSLERIVEQYLQESDKDQRFVAWWVQRGSAPA